MILKIKINKKRFEGGIMGHWGYRYGFIWLNVVMSFLVSWVVLYPDVPSCFCREVPRYCAKGGIIGCIWVRQQLILLKWLLPYLHNFNEVDSPKVVITIPT